MTLEKGTTCKWCNARKERRTKAGMWMESFQGKSRSLIGGWRQQLYIHEGKRYLNTLCGARYDLYSGLRRRLEPDTGAIDRANDTHSEPEFLDLGEPVETCDRRNGLPRAEDDKRKNDGGPSNVESYSSRGSNCMFLFLTKHPTSFTSHYHTPRHQMRRRFRRIFFHIESSRFSCCRGWATTRPGWHVLCRLFFWVFERTSVVGARTGAGYGGSVFGTSVPDKRTRRARLSAKRESGTGAEGEGENGMPPRREQREQ